MNDHAGFFKQSTTASLGAKSVAEALGLQPIAGSWYAPSPISRANPRGQFYPGGPVHGIFALFMPGMQGHADSLADVYRADAELSIVPAFPKDTLLRLGTDDSEVFSERLFSLSAPGSQYEVVVGLLCRYFSYEALASLPTKPGAYERTLVAHGGGLRFGPGAYGEFAVDLLPVAPSEIAAATEDLEAQGHSVREINAQSVSRLVRLCKGHGWVQDR